MAATRKRWMARFSALILGAFTSLVLAALVPMVTGPGSVEPVGSGSRVEAASFDSFAISAPITLLKSPMLRLEHGTVSIDRSAVNKNEMPRLILDRPQFTTETTALLNIAKEGREAEGRDDDHWLPAVARALADLGFEKLSIRGGSVTVRWSTETAPNPSMISNAVELKDLNADVSSARKGVVTAKGEARLFGERVTFDSAIATTTEVIATDIIRRGLKLSIKAPTLQVDFDGRIESGSAVRLLGQVDANVSSASALTQWLAVPMPQSPIFQDVQLKGQMHWANGTVAIDKAVITSDRQAPATGAISLGFNGPRPVINATLAYGAFDLGAFVSAGLPGTLHFEPADRHWRSMTAALPHIKYIDADVRVSANMVRFGESQLGRGAASIVVQSGKMTVDLAELATADDRVNAQIGIDMTGPQPRYNLRGKLETANLGPRFDGGPVPGFISGKAEIQFDIKGQGETLSQVLSVAAGRLSLRTGTGSRATLDTRALKTLAEYHARRDGSKPPTPASPSVLAKSPQPIDTIDARMTILGGVATIDQATIKQSGLVTQVTGWIDTNTRKLNLNAVQHPIQGAPSANARKPVAGDSNSYEVKGPWTELLVQRLENAAAQP